MGIEIVDGRIVSVEGKAHVALYRLMMIRSGLVLERDTGMRLTSKAPKCTTICRREFGFKGNHTKMLQQLDAKIKAEYPEEAPKLGIN